MKHKLIILYVKLISLLNIVYMRRKKVIIESNDLIIKGKPFIKNKGNFIIEKNVRINSKYSVNPIGGALFSSFVLENNASLKIGEGTRISNSAFFCKQSISIGKNVFIGGNTKIYDTDFHSLILNNRIQTIDPDVSTKPIIIEDGVFIGGSSIILKGITIGKNSIIGAGSVVTKSIPDNEIWGGNPAKFIKKVSQND